MSPASAAYWGIPGYVFFWLFLAIALVFFVLRVRFLYRLLRLGRPENRFDNLPSRLRGMLKIALSQSSNLKTVSWKDPASVGHSLMFWGLILFGAGYLIFIGLGAGLGLFSIYTGSGFERVCFSILDIAGLLVILSIIWVVIKRYIIRPERLARAQDPEEKIIQAGLLTVMTLLMLLHFGIEGFGYAAGAMSGSWPPVGMALANLISNSTISDQTMSVVFKSLWWFNYLLLVAAVIYAPRSKHLHPLTSFFNLTFQNREPRGVLRDVDLEHPELAGASKIQDFSWKQLLDLYSCTWCGKCHTVCPARLSGKPLDPREMILGMKELLLEQGPALLKTSAVHSNSQQAVPPVEEMASDSALVQPAGGKNTGTPSPTVSPDHKLIGDVVSEEALWACTTCRACQEICPVSIEHIEKIVDMRRYLQMVATCDTGRDALKNLRVRGNPWRGTTFARTDWAEGLDIKIVGEDSNVDVLFWVGCTEALEERSLKVAQSVARLMKAAGVNFGILGEEEMCCGDPARRLGAEHIYQMLAANNIQLLQSYNIKKIVTACPHCFNTLKNEYPRLGGQFEVVHHTRFIAELISQGRLKFKGRNQGPETSAAPSIIAYQDPCYLGRYNDIYEDPRRILGSLPGVRMVEMTAARRDAVCCGGGGGRMWLEEKSGQRISEIRLNQGLQSGARILATACPFCLQMLEDASRSKEGEASLPVKDVAELAADCLDSPDQANS